MQEYQPLETKKFLTPDEIESHLEGVEYIIMAAPAVHEGAKYPLHFTIFLNTDEKLPREIQEAIIGKFCSQHKITAIDSLMSQLSDVAFAQTAQETPMPLHLFTPEDRGTMPHTTMHVIDFLGDAEGFNEAKNGATGWSYSYN